MASKSNEDAMLLKVNDGNYIHIEGYRKERGGEKYVKTVECIFQSVYGQDINILAKLCYGIQKLYRQKMPFCRL